MSCTNEPLLKFDTRSKPSTQESVFCSMLDQYYNALEDIIKAALNYPVLALQTLKSSFARIVNITLKSIESALQYLIDYVVGLLGLGNFDNSQGKNDFCRMAYACEAVIDFLFNTDSDAISFLPGSGSLLQRVGLTESQINLAKNSYSKFEEIVCKQTLSGIVNSWTSEGLDWVSAELDKIKTKLLKASDTFFDSLITDYLQILEDHKIFEYLAQLDKFENCAFATCNFVETARNYRNVVSNKLSIQKSTLGTWEFVTTDFMDKAYSLSESLNTKINSLETNINAWKNDCTRNIVTGVPKKELMKL